ncbi:MAG TPA: transcriptional regulator [Maritimibacter sp.]|nr:transcriptional regulator [Maritimibacter sp.]
MDDNWYSDEAATFGDRLAAARDAVGLSQKELAKRIGVKTKTLAAWENDITEPRANRLQLMSGLLNVSLGWLLTGEGDGVEPPAEDTSMADAQALVLELREIRGDMTDAMQRLARLEKALRHVTRERNE